MVRTAKWLTAVLALAMLAGCAPLEEAPRPGDDGVGYASGAGLSRPIRWVGAHWTVRTQDTARTIGNFVFVNADTLGDTAMMQRIRDNGLYFVLEFFFTEERMFDIGGGWWRDINNARNYLAQIGMLDRVIAIGLDDEIYSRAQGGAFQHWAALRGTTPGTWMFPYLASLLAARTVQLDQVFGLPVGVAETGMIDAPVFPGQDWIGLNSYLIAPIGPASYDVVERAYAGAARHGLPIMAVLPTFRDPSGLWAEMPRLDQLGWYLGIIERYPVAAIAYFCLEHPSIYDPRHGPRGYGLTDYPDHLRALQQFWQSNAPGGRAQFGQLD